MDVLLGSGGWLGNSKSVMLLSGDWSYWKEAILHDRERVHPDIRQCVSRIDIMRMGHAIARPTIGSIFSPERRSLAKLHGGLLFADSDLSGCSIFEEAGCGVVAAEYALHRISGWRPKWRRRK